MLFIVLCALGIASSFAQSTFSGTVIGPDGLGLPGVSVVEKANPKNGVYTDIDGKWSLKVPNGKSVLEFTSIGFKTVLIIAKDAAKINMKADTQMLGEVEVVATGYGTAAKAGYTGSAAVVKNDDLIKTGGGISGALQGKVAGVQIMGDDVRIRGYGSMSASSSPIYVVDGVINAPRPNDEDIESITVLKDAASTALYGSKGANGVIVITSKKVREGKTRFNLKYQHTFNTLLKPEWDRMNASQYYQYQFNSYRNSYPKLAEGELYAKFMKKMRYTNPYNMDKPFDMDGTLKENAKLLYDTNWADSYYVNNIAHKDRIYFSIAGGSAKTHYNIATKFFNSDGYTKIYNKKYISNDISFDSQLNKHIRFDIRTKITYSQYKSGATGEGSIYDFSPAAPIYKLTKKDNGDGTYTYEEKSPREFDWNNPNYLDNNPIALSQKDPDTGYSSSIYVAPKITIEFMKNLSLSSLLVGKYYSDRDDSFRNNGHGPGASENGISYASSSSSRSYMWQNLLNYSTSFADKHHFDIILGSELSDYTSKDISAAAKGYPLGAASTELTTGEEPKYVRSSTLEIARISYFSRFGYNLDGKYYLSASYRTDGSSKFGEDNRWGNFWSVGASWRISQEDFFNVDWVDNLKLRASYGVTGNDGIKAYQFGNYYSFGNRYSYNGKVGMLHTSLANSLLGWEESTSLSVGLDFDLFSHRLNGSVEVYERGSDGLLYNYPIPTTSGFSSILMNVGEMTNKGVEVELNGIILNKNQMLWRSGLTFSTNKNEIITLPQHQEKTVGTKRWKEGSSMYEYYLKEWAGVDANNGDPLWYMDKKNADGTVEKVTTNNYDDATFYSNIGQSTPKVYLGLSNSFAYKGFDFSIDVLGAFGHKIYDGYYRRAMHDGNNGASNLAVDALKAWTPNNRDTNIPKSYFLGSNKSNYASTRWLVDGDFVKIKNIAVGYTLPEHLVSKMSLLSARVFLTIDNVYSFSDYRSGDPEISLSGVSGAGYSGGCSYRVGVDIKF